MPTSSDLIGATAQRHTFVRVRGCLSGQNRGARVTAAVECTLQQTLPLPECGMIPLSVLSKKHSRLHATGKPVATVSHPPGVTRMLPG